MFRCISELKGLIIDTDSFLDEDISEWDGLLKDYKFLFLSSDKKRTTELINHFGTELVLNLDEKEMLFVPNNQTHAEILNITGLNSTQIAYVSKDIFFITRALKYLCGSIYITKEMSYEDASTAADLICGSIQQLQALLNEGADGFFGEKMFYPATSNRGLIIPVKFDVDGTEYKMFMLGRYYSYAHYMNNLHPYSSSIYLNKQHGRAEGVFDRKFYSLLRGTINTLIKHYDIDSICAVPPRPGNKNRFKTIIRKLAENFAWEDLSDSIICISNYQPQKSLSYVERERNVYDVFEVNGDIHERKILIIDDISTSGATLKSCVRELKANGAEQIYIIVYAVNQIKGAYWSSNVAEVKCPLCNHKMKLLINSNDASFFYLCTNDECIKTMNYDIGRNILEKIVSSEKYVADDDSDINFFDWF